jgi:hypothetical protein
MRFADGNALVSPALTAAVLAVAVLLARRQLAERRGRVQEMTAADRRHFGRQDVRRLTGSAVMALIGLGIAWGSWIDPRGDGWSKRLFLSVWLVVILLVFFLVMLALLDLLSTRLYARRQGRVLIAERREALRAQSRRRPPPETGRNGLNGPIGGPSPP